MKPVRAVLLAAIAGFVVACPSEANHPPQLVPVADARVDVGETLTVKLAVTDPDGDTVILALEQAPTTATLDVDEFAFTANTEGVGSHPVVVKATDDGSPPLTSYLAFTITIVAPDVPDPPNHPPVATPVPAVSLVPGDAMKLFLTADDPDGDPLHWTLLGGPAGLTLGVDPAVVRWTPTADAIGTYTAMLMVVDDGVPPLADFVLLQITVREELVVDHRPEFVDGPEAITAGACEKLVATFEATDPDGDVVLYFSPDLPEGAILTPSGSDVLLRWAPRLAQAGRYIVQIYAFADVAPGHFDVHTVTIDVLPTAPPASLVPLPEQHVTGGQTVTVLPTYRTVCPDLEVAGLEMLPAGWAVELVGPQTATIAEVGEPIVWPTVPEDFGIHDLVLRLTSAEPPGATIEVTMRTFVEFVDDFRTFTGWAEHVTVQYFRYYYAPHVVVPDTSAMDGYALMANRHYVDDPPHRLRAYRTFSRGTVPIADVAIDFVAMERNYWGARCGGGAFELYGFEVTEPNTLWPRGADTPAAAWRVDVTSRSYTATSTAVTLSAPTTAVTAALYLDNWNYSCDTWARWDQVVLRPIAP